MRRIRGAVLAGVAALAAAGTAVAAGNDRHVLKVDLPDGSVAHVEYEGEVAPKVVVEPGLAFEPVRWFDPLATAPFAMLDRIAAEMERRADMMIEQARALPIQPDPRDGKIDLAGSGALPAGTVSYSFVSTGTGTGTCSRSVQVTSLGPGQQPKIVSNSSGDCHDASPVPTATGVDSAHRAGVPTPPPAAAGRSGKFLQTT